MDEMAKRTSAPYRKRNVCLCVDLLTQIFHSVSLLLPVILDFPHFLTPTGKSVFPKPRLSYPGLYVTTVRGFVSSFILERYNFFAYGNYMRIFFAICNFPGI